MIPLRPASTLAHAAAAADCERVGPGEEAELRGRSRISAKRGRKKIFVRIELSATHSEFISAKTATGAFVSTRNLNAIFP